MATGKKTGGRTAGSVTKVPSIKEMASKHGAAALKALVSIVENSKNEGNRITAASQILDRAYGKPTQSVGTDPDMPVELVISWKK